MSVLHDVSARWPRLAVLPFLGCGLIAAALGAPPSPVAAASAPVTLNGQLRIGSAPAPDGGTVYAWTDQGVRDDTPCGQATVGLSGQYSLPIQPLPECVSKNNNPLQFLITYEGMAAKNWSNNVTPAQPLGAVPLNLLVPFIPFAPMSTIALVTSPVPIRFYGVLREGNAPDGTWTDPTTSITAVTGQSSVATSTRCGSGGVLDSLGDYYVDITAPLPLACTDQGNDGGGVNFTFYEDSPECQQCPIGSSPRHLDGQRPTSWGATYQVNLHGTSPLPPSVVYPGP